MPKPKTGNEVLFNPALEQALDQAWDATNEYPLYNVDSAILNAQGDMESIARGSFHAYHFETPEATEARWERAESAVKLLPDRFAELHATGEWTGDGEYSRHETEISRMCRAVFDAWKTHYFLPRVEPATLELHNEYVLARAQYAGLREDRVYRRGSDAEFDFWPSYRALSSMALVPLYASAAIDSLIVPPNVAVTGNPGHARVYRWDQVDAPPTNLDNHLDLYPSTCTLLAGKGFKQFADVLPVDRLLEAERALMNKSAESGQ